VTGPFFQRVYRMVERIPAGQVATYGQIAWLVGKPQGARTVGWALRALKPGSGVPWHRVVNARGGISIAERTHQRALLESEGVAFDERDRIDLDVFGWEGPGNEIRRSSQT
jgi:methylated-DNA-protein-cysteine methyltransferase-like protein